MSPPAACLPPAPRRERSPEGGLLLGALAVAGAAIGLADLALDLAFPRARHVGPPATEALFPWTARLDLLVLLGLCALVACVVAITAPGAPRDQNRRRHAGRARGARVPLALAGCLALVAGALFGPLSGGLVLVVYAAVLWAGPRLAGADLRLLLAVALGARVLAALGLGAYGLATQANPVVLDDEEAYHRAAGQIAGILIAGTGDLDPAWWHLPGPYLSLLGSIYLVAGPSVTAMRLVNAGLGALGVALVFGIARPLFGPSAARAVCWAVALWPALVLWSGTGLREALFGTGALVVPWLLSRDAEASGRPGRLLVAVTGALAILVLLSLRSYAALAILAPLAIAAARPLARWAGKRPRAALLVGPAALLALVAAWARLSAGPPPVAGESPSAAVVGQLSARALEYRAAAIELSPLVAFNPRERPAPPDPTLLEAGTIVRVQLPGEAGLTTAIVTGYERDPSRYRVVPEKGEAVLLTPEHVQRLSDANVGWDAPLARLAGGLRLLLVPPAPWGAERVQRLITIPDAVAWDALGGLALLAAWRERGRWSAVWLVLLGYPPLMLLALGAVSSNLGTAVRHRGMLVAWLAILAAPTLARLFARLPDAPRRPVSLPVGAAPARTGPLREPPA